MPTQRVANTASAVTLTLATEVLVVTVTPQAPNNQVNPNAPNVEIRADVVITGAASATTCALNIIRGATVNAGDVLAADIVAAVDGSAISRAYTVVAQDTAANFNTNNGQYSLVATAAGAAQAAQYASIAVQDLAPGV